MRHRITVLLLSTLLLVLCNCSGNQSEKSKTVEAEQAVKQKSIGIPPELIDSIIIPFNKGVALMDRFQPVEAVAAFEEVTALAPDWVLGRLNYGIALLNAQSDEYYARAETELKWVIEKQPDNPYAHYALGMLLRHLTRFEEAKTQFEAVLEIDPEDADAHYQLGILILDEQPEAARTHLEKTLAKIPHHESACYRLGMLLKKSGEKERAKEMLSRFRTLKKAKAGVFSGMKYGEMGHYAEVIRVFDTPLPARENHGPPVYTEVSATMGLREPATTTPGWPGPATSFGPGIAAADIMGDGFLSVYITGTESGGILYHNKEGGLSPVQDTGIDGRGAIGAWFGDYDGDGDPDLYLTRNGPNRLYRNEGNGKFSDVTEKSGTAGGPELSVSAAWADADHDGDLDIYVANFALEANKGAANALWRNNGDETFIETAAQAGIDGGNAATSGVLYFDFDDDRDLDLYLINEGSANRLFLNDRVGKYTDATSWFPQLADEGPGLGVLPGDLDGNGREDLLLLRGPQPPRLFLRSDDSSRFTPDNSFAAIARKIGGAAGGLVGDLDLDGDLDLVLLDAGSGNKLGHRILMNLGAGRFDEPVLLGEEVAEPRARGALPLDLDGDGSLELLVTRAGETPQVWKAPTPEGRHWLSVLPAKSEEEADKLWLDPTATGLLVEIKSGRHLQVAGLSSTSGYLASPPRRAHFGLGGRATADYVRLSWTDGVFQSELEVAADQRWRINKMLRKPSSCPILFTWDGERFAFVTDFLGVGGIGFFVAPGQYAPPDPSEHVRIPPELIKPKDGSYLLHVTEPLEEVTYLDQLRLIVYEHPADWEIYPDERFTATAPFPDGRPRAVREKIRPRAARDRHGKDMLDLVRAIDRRYVKPPRDPRFTGYAEDHWLELDFSGRLRDIDPKAPLVLYLYGWVEYTYSHLNYAAGQAGITMKSPWIEVPDGNGGWCMAVPELGFPAGLPRMMTFDVSDLPLRQDGRMRIRTNMEVFWDQVFIAEDVRDHRLRTHTLQPVRADLRYLGYPREYSPDGGDPTLYDYHRTDRGVPFKNMTGDFTRYGDVRELLKKTDDRFVIMARGEEIALTFDATSLPPLPHGRTRTLVLHADGYCKDMDLYTAYPDTVNPLPYHAMDNYPPSYPPANEAELARDRARWNTRHIEGNAREILKPTPGPFPASSAKSEQTRHPQ